MTREFFKEQFQRVCLLFNVTKPIDKAKIYFDCLEKYSNEALEKGIKEIINTKDRLPSIAQFKEILNQHQKTLNHKFSCDDCSGTGFQMFINYAYRCRCPNGDRLSKMIRQYPESEEIERINLEKEEERAKKY